MRLMVVREVPVVAAALRFLRELQVQVAQVTRHQLRHRKEAMAAQVVR